MISAAQCFALLAVFFSVALASVPAIERNEIQHVAKAEPWRVTTPESDRVDKHVQLCSDENRGTQWRRGWADPAEHGGSMLDLVGNGFREPINVIISGASDQSLMSDQGQVNWVLLRVPASSCWRITACQSRRRPGVCAAIVRIPKYLFAKIARCLDRRVLGKPSGWQSFPGLAPERLFSKHGRVVLGRVEGGRCNQEPHDFNQWL